MEISKVPDSLGGRRALCNLGELAQNGAPAAWKFPKFLIPSGGRRALCA